MKMRNAIALSVLGGVVAGGLVIEGLHAQAKPPVYFIASIDEISDQAMDTANAGRSNAAAAELLKDFGGQYVARTTGITPLDGVAPKRIIVTRFPDAEKAKAWYNSPEQKKVNEIRAKSTKSRAFIVDGL